MSQPAGDPPAPPPAGGGADPAVPPTQQQPPAPTALETALASERARNQELERQIGESRARDEAARLASMDEAARKIEEARIAVRNELQGEHKKELLTYRVRAAAGAFHDAALTAELVIGGGLPVDATDEQVTAALAQIAADKPYLVKGGTPPPAIPQGPSGGGGNGGQPPVADGETFIRGLWKDRQRGENLQV